MKNILALAFVTIASASFAATWTEVGDAGYLNTTAQLTGPSGFALTEINGTRGTGSSNDRADLYIIQIKDVQAFTASTDAADGGAAQFDTRLMLFKMDGTGVVFNDDTPAGLGPSKILGSSGLIPSAGYYLLGIDAYSSTQGPSSAAGLIWNLGSPWTVNKAPDGPGAAGVLNGWGTATTGSGTGTYRIALTGASTVPEPTTMAALGLGLAAIARRRRNKK